MMVGDHGGTGASCQHDAEYNRAVNMMSGYKDDKRGSSRP